MDHKGKRSKVTEYVDLYISGFKDLGLTRGSRCRPLIKSTSGNIPDLNINTGPKQVERAPRDATRDARSERSPGTRLHTHPAMQLHECAVQVCKDRACVSRRRQNAYDKSGARLSAL